MNIRKGDTLLCYMPPGYGKWHLGDRYGIAKITEDEVLVRDAKNERKNFSLDERSHYYVGHYFTARITAK